MPERGDIGFDEYGRVVIRDPDLARQLFRSIRDHGRLVVHAPGIAEPDVDLLRICKDPPPRTLDICPNTMCDCELELTWRNPGRAMPGERPPRPSDAD